MFPINLKVMVAVFFCGFSMAMASGVCKNDFVKRIWINEANSTLFQTGSLCSGMPCTLDAANPEAKKSMMAALMMARTTGEKVFIEYSSDVDKGCQTYTSGPWMPLRVLSIRVGEAE